MVKTLGGREEEAEEAEPAEGADLHFLAGVPLPGLPGRDNGFGLADSPTHYAGPSPGLLQAGLQRDQERGS